MVIRVWCVWAVHSSGSTGQRWFIFVVGEVLCRFASLRGWAYHERSVVEAVQRGSLWTFFYQNACGMGKCLYFCSTRTRQASQRCSNVRVVLFLYPWIAGFHFKNPTPIPATLLVCYNRADLSSLTQPKQNATLNTSAIIACQPICTPFSRICNSGGENISICNAEKQR